MGIVGRNHKRPFYALIKGFLTSTLSHSDTLQHHREERTACTLLGLRTSFFIVEDGQHLRSINGLCSDHRLQACKAHREVVQAS